MGARSREPLPESGRISGPVFSAACVSSDRGGASDGGGGISAGCGAGKYEIYRSPVCTVVFCARTSAMQAGSGGRSGRFKSGRGAVRGVLERDCLRHAAPSAGGQPCHDECMQSISGIRNLCGGSCRG